MSAGKVRYKTGCIFMEMILTRIDDDYRNGESILNGGPICQKNHTPA